MYTNISQHRSDSRLDPFAPSTVLAHSCADAGGRLTQVERRALILAETRRLLAEEGASFSMRDLAAASQTSVQQIYNSFGTKLETIGAAIQEFNSRLMEEAFKSGSYGRSALSLFDTVAQGAVEHPSYLRQVIQTMYKYPDLLDKLHHHCSTKILKFNPVSFKRFPDISASGRRIVTRQLVYISTSSVFEWSIGACATKELRPRIRLNAQALLHGFGVDVDSGDCGSETRELAQNILK